MKKYSNSFFALIVTLLILSSCGGGGSEYSISEFSSDFDQVACDKLVECDLYDTTAECLNDADSNFSESDCPDFDGDLAQECLDQIEALDCDFNGSIEACENLCPGAI